MPMKLFHMCVTNDDYETVSYIHNILGQPNRHSQKHFRGKEQTLLTWLKCFVIWSIWWKEKQTEH